MEITCTISAMWNAAGNKVPAWSHFRMALQTAENSSCEGTVPLYACLNRTDDYNKICCYFFYYMLLQDREVLMYRVLSESADSTKIFGILDGNSMCFSQSFLLSFVRILLVVLLLNLKIWEGFIQWSFQSFFCP